MKLVYIKDLGHDNYKRYTNDILHSIREVIRFEEIDLNRLAGLIGIARQTLYRHIKLKNNISFKSLNKMNNFLMRYKRKMELS